MGLSAAEEFVEHGEQFGKVGVGLAAERIWVFS